MLYELKNKLKDVKRKVFKKRYMIDFQETLDNAIAEETLKEMGLSSTDKSSYKSIISYKISDLYFDNAKANIVANLLKNTNMSEKEVYQTISDKVDELDVFKDGYTRLQTHEEYELTAKLLDIEKADEYVDEAVRLIYNQRLEKANILKKHLNENIHDIEKSKIENKKLKDFNFIDRYKIKRENKKTNAELDEIYEAVKDNNDPVLFDTLMRNASYPLDFIYTYLFEVGITDKNILKGLLTDAEIKYSNISTHRVPSYILGLDYESFSEVSAQYKFGDLNEKHKQELKDLTEKYMNKENVKDNAKDNETKKTIDVDKILL